MNRFWGILGMCEKRGRYVYEKEISGTFDCNFIGGLCCRMRQYSGRKKETNTTAAQESVSEASTDEGDKTKAAESDVELTFLHGQELLKRLCWKKLLQDLQMLRE